VAGRIAASPARAVLEVSGGQAPQHLVNEFAAVIARGGSEVTLIFGSEAISTVEHFARAQDRPDRPDFSEHADGSLEDRGYGLAGMMSRHRAAHGLTGAPSQYALIDNARRARLGQTREEYAAAMGALFAPFTRVAAANPHASAPVERDAAELVTPTEANRPIADPYTRYIVAREKVNQGAAVLLMSVAAARRLGVPADRWVFLPGHADLRERDLLERADLSAGPASAMAVRHALAGAGIGPDAHVRAAAATHGRGHGDPTGPSRGARQRRSHGYVLHRADHRLAQRQSRWRHALPSNHQRGERARHLLEPENRQGGARLYPRRDRERSPERPEHRVHRRAGVGESTRVHGGAEQHAGGGHDPAAGSGHGVRRGR